jgi:hypothetical protein
MNKLAVWMQRLLRLIYSINLVCLYVRNVEKQRFFCKRYKIY